MLHISSNVSLLSPQMLFLFLIYTTKRKKMLRAQFIVLFSCGIKIAQHGKRRMVSFF